jgi:hypothetical protein
VGVAHLQQRYIVVEIQREPALVLFGIKLISSGTEGSSAARASVRSSQT